MKEVKYYIYVIHSLVDGRLYVGMTSSLLRRINDHNQGHVFSTKGYKPWKLVYKEIFSTRPIARK